MEVEYKGISMKGGKLFIIFSLLGTLGGGLWGAFEFWKDYQTLQSRVENFISPDMSKYDEQIAVLKSEISSVLEEVSLVNDVASQMQTTIREDLKLIKSDVRAIDKVVNDIEDRVKANEREISTDFKILEKEIDDKIRKALNNPLAGVK
jgi:hypothetical protein